MTQKFKDQKIINVFFFFFLAILLECYIVLVENSYLVLEFSGNDFINLFSIKEFIVFLVVSVLLAIVVMMQEGKDNGLTSTLSGNVDSYWNKNKGTSKKARLNKATAVLGTLFMVLALLLSSKFIK